MKTLYKEKLVPELQKQLGLKNPMAVPRLKKVTLNIGIGSYVRSGDKNFDPVIDNLTRLSGQKPVVTRARKDVSNFKLRAGQEVGMTVTLRGKRMYDFVNRLVNIVLPRIRDFRGMSTKGFDGQGNYSLGLKEVTVFPEVNPDTLSRNHGLQLSIVTTAENNEKGFALLKAMGFPFRDDVQAPKKKKAKKVSRDPSVEKESPSTPS